MESGARWGSLEVSWADSCLVGDGGDGADNWVSPNDFGARNAPPAWTPLSCEDHEEAPIPTISPFREAAQERADEVLQGWNGNPLDFDEHFAVSSLLDTEEEPLNIFPTWDLNTQSPRVRDDDVLEFLAWTVPHSDQNGSSPEDGSDLGVNPAPTVDVFDLNALSSTLEEEPGLESLIAGMADLNIAV